MAAKILMKTALVTGASRGLGAEIASLLREQGFAVLAPPRSVMDVGNARSVQRAQQLMAARTSKIDVLVNCAAILSEDLNRCMEVNAFGPQRVMKAFWLMMARPGGRVVNVSSREGLSGSFGGRPYSASKRALNEIVRTEANNPDGVIVTACCPGWFRSRLGGDKAPQSATEAADTPVWLATEAPDTTNGCFYINRAQVPW